jgi:hypothetical protein
MIGMLHRCSMVRAATASQATRTIHASVCRRLKDNVYVTTTTAVMNDDTQTRSTAFGGSSCSKPELNNAVGQDEEEEQEEMFVMADPSLGVGSIREWGGPTRGGRLAEPTRFGDWERKGRCTDF